MPPARPSPRTEPSRPPAADLPAPAAGSGAPAHPLSRSELATLEQEARRFEREIRWRFKLARVDRIQDHDGRPTAVRGGFSGVARVVDLGSRRVFLKGWPWMSRLDRGLANVAEVLGAWGNRRVPWSEAVRIRYDHGRRRDLLARGVRVPEPIEIPVQRVLATEYLDGFASLRGLRSRRDWPLEPKLALLQAVAVHLRALHDRGGYHGEPGAGNILVHPAHLEPSRDWRVAFTDFEWRYVRHIPLVDRQAHDLRYYAMQQAGRLAAVERARHRLPPWSRAARDLAWGTARRVIDAILLGYGPSPVADRVLHLSRTGPRMLMEAVGYMGVGPVLHRRVQQVLDRQILRLLEKGTEKFRITLDPRTGAAHGGTE